MDYWQWRYGLTINIMSASPQPQLIQVFIDEISNPGVSDAQLFTCRDPRVASIDMKLFASIVQLLISIPSDDTARILSTIRMHCTLLLINTCPSYRVSDIWPPKRCEALGGLILSH